MVDFPKVWQISPPGPVANSVADFCIQYGVALMWPGDAGPWNPQHPPADFAETDWVRWFAETMSVGDAVLLRTSPTRIRAIGLIASDYLYEDRFDDVHGFDLQHCRRVRWYRLPREHDFSDAVFTKGRLSLVRTPSVRDYVRRFLGSPPTDWQEANLPGLPPEEPPLSATPIALQDIVAQAQDLFHLYTDGSGFGDQPSEDELITHFVVPFLRVLGWKPELIAVKWRNVDVAVFHALPRTPGNCRFVIEAKRSGVGVDGALQQARRYVEHLATSADVIVTDGIRYRLFANSRAFDAVAYANLAKLKRSALALFEAMKTDKGDSGDGPLV